MPDQLLPPRDTRSVGHVLTRFGKEVAFSVAASLALASMNWWLPALSNAVAGPADQVPAVQGLDTNTVILRDASPQAAIQDRGTHAQVQTRAAVGTHAERSAADLTPPSGGRWSDQLSDAFATIEAPTFADVSAASWPNDSHANQAHAEPDFASFGSHDVFGREAEIGPSEREAGHDREQPVSFDPDRRAASMSGDHGFAGGPAFGGHGPRSR